jgi:mannose-6-phosphate isomerase-like protein (cupin superfamily)
MDKAQIKSMNQPYEVRDFNHGRVELVHMSVGTIGRYVLEPGWRWADAVKPIAKTELCEAQHYQYVVSGRLGVRMSDGEEFELKAGDVSFLPPGHDSWVIGNESVVIVDWAGAVHFAKGQ